MEIAARETLAGLSVTTVRSIRQPVVSLSGGQRQAVAVARSVMWNSELVIMDEPTAALGVAQTAMVLELVRRLADRGLAVMLISHNINDVFEVADRLVVLHLGRMVAAGPATDFDRQIVVDYMTTGRSDRAPHPTDRARSRRKGGPRVAKTTEPPVEAGDVDDEQPTRPPVAAQATVDELTANTFARVLPRLDRARARRAERRAARRHRPVPHLDHLPEPELELPDRRQPGQPAGAGRGVHPAGHGRGVRAAARRDRPVGRLRRRHRRDHRGRAGHQ